MSSRRAQGIGSLRERPSGSGIWRWEARAGTDPVTGQPRRVSRTFEAKTRSAAEKIARRYLAELEAEPATGSEAPFSTLLDEYQRFSTAKGNSPTTIYKNGQIIEKEIAPALGDIPLNKLTARHLDKFYLGLSERGLSAASVQRYHAIIRAALGHAVRWGWIEKNPAERAAPPKAKAKRIEVPRIEEVQAIISGLQDRKPLYGMAAFLLAATGARRGEACALRWADYDGVALSIHSSVYKVGQSYGIKDTKTGDSRLVIVSDELRHAIEAWRVECERIAGLAGVELGPDDFILSPWPDGSKPLNPDTLSAAFATVAKGLGFDHVHVHSLRHFAATEMLAQGTSPQDTAEVLGHSNPRMTLNVYAHSTTERQKAALSALGSTLGALPSLPTR